MITLHDPKDYDGVCGQNECSARSAYTVTVIGDDGNSWLLSSCARHVAGLRSDREVQIVKIATDAESVTI